MAIHRINTFQASVESWMFLFKKHKRSILSTEPLISVPVGAAGGREEVDGGGCADGAPCGGDGRCVGRGKRGPLRQLFQPLFLRKRTIFRTPNEYQHGSRLMTPLLLCTLVATVCRVFVCFPG